MEAVIALKAASISVTKKTAEEGEFCKTCDRAFAKRGKGVTNKTTDMLPATIPPTARDLPCLEGVPYLCNRCVTTVAYFFPFKPVKYPSADRLRATNEIKGGCDIARLATLIAEHRNSNA